IWFGDEHAAGTLGLILAEPARTLVGWGPESMMVAYGRFYPPSLADLTPEGSPDRAHQLFLDVLATRGLLGLASYLAVLLAAIGAGLRGLRSAGDIRLRCIVVGALGSIVGILITDQTGIPVSSTTLLSWALFAVLHAASRPGGAASPATTPKSAP